MSQGQDNTKKIMGATIVVLLIVVFYSFGSKDKEVVVTTGVDTSQEVASTNQQPSNPEPLVARATDIKYVVAVDKSDIKWEGFKIVPVTTHFGGINLKEGTLYQDAEGNITAGKFVIDMNSITNGDLTDPADNNRIINKLKSEDFFDVANYPVAILEITNVKKLPEEAGDVNYQLAGNLTIKGITHNITFPAVIGVENDILTAQAKIDIDRTLWDVRFGSLKFGPDAIVKDVMTLNVSLVATK